MRTLQSLLAFSLLFIACSCKKDSQSTTGVAAPALIRGTLAATVTTETFETGTKAAYAAGNVTLATGTWTFTDALIGNLTTDHKIGTQAARIRNSGKITMDFDHAAGASTVTIQHAVFGTDGSSTWQLWYSINGGSTYTQAGSTITTSSTTLQAATFTITATGAIRFELRKTDGTANRIDIDNFAITDAGTGGGNPPPPPPGGKKFLFDATKAETAGNADWVIDEDGGTPQRTPTPAQSTITASTAETFWTGALSSWGIALVKAGNSVETLPSGTAITFGNTSNPQDLSNYDVFVVDEPNILFTAAEKTAILNFIHAGGGLFMISDHNGSDRNNDGHDSPNIWNDLMTNNGIVSNPFGFSIDLVDISETSSNLLTNRSTNPILNGSQGTVTTLEFNDGATITIQPSVNSTVQGLIWQTTATSQGNTNIMSASSTYGTGRVYVVTDSSPMDDGTGAAGNNLFVSWSIPSQTALFMNASLWLAKLQ